jgi:flagellar biosynthesis/type III secretory pathway chaperone
MKKVLKLLHLSFYVYCCVFVGNASFYHSYTIVPKRHPRRLISEELSSGLNYINKLISTGFCVVNDQEKDLKKSAIECYVRFNEELKRLSQGKSGILSQLDALEELRIFQMTVQFYGNLEKLFNLNSTNFDDRSKKIDKFVQDWQQSQIQTGTE